MLLSTDVKLMQGANKPPAFYSFLIFFTPHAPLTSDIAGFIINKGKPTDWSDDEKWN